MRSTRTMRSRAVLALSVAIAAALLVTGCSGNDSLARQYRSGDTKNYISGDGAVSEFSAKHPGTVIDFSTTTMDGRRVTAADYRGKVLVLNFWFATCGPCRVEAKDLGAVSTAEADRANFLGVDVRDSAGTAAAFVRRFDVPYPTVVDGADSAVQLAFSGAAAPNATPSTIVLDKEGHVSALILGVANRSVLTSLIATAAARP